MEIKRVHFVMRGYTDVYTDNDMTAVGVSTNQVEVSGFPEYWCEDWEVDSVETIEEEG